MYRGVLLVMVSVGLYRFHSSFAWLDLVFFLNEPK